MRHRLAPLAIAAASLVLVPSAGAVGRPPSAALGGPGVVSLDGKTRYVALSAPNGGTRVEARSAASGAVLRSQVVPWRVGIPVAAGRTGTGLSGDGKVLVLGTIHSQNPGDTIASTTVVALATTLSATPRTFTLPGDFSVDAISPTARWLYLIQRRDGNAGVLDYAVRAFDMRSGALVPGTIVDRREPNEKMAGYPVARTTTLDGRWAFTIYDGLGKHSFVHALDTVTRTARCLDLPSSVAESDVWSLAFRDVSNGRLAIGMARRAPVAWIDLRTITLHAAPAAT
jgi:hypothetical protein